MPSASPNATAADHVPHGEARHHLRESLQEQLGLHDTKQAKSGSEYAPQIAQLAWSSAARRVSCSLDDTQSEEQPYRITLDLPGAVGEPLNVSCSCGQSTDLGRCEHTWAAIRRMIDLIDAPEKKNPLLLDILSLRRNPAWYGTLDLLDDFLGEELSPDLDAAPEHRLSWRVRFGPHGVDLAAWEQRISRQNGDWTAGRRVGWERLRSTPELWTCAADRAAAAAVREHHAEGWDDTPDPVWLWEIDTFSALRALAGHSMVFDWDQPDERIKVEEVVIRLNVDLDEANMILDAVLGDRPLSTFARHHVQEDEKERGIIAGVAESGDGDGEGRLTRVITAKTDARVLQLIRTLDGAQRTVPPEGQEALLRRLARLETVLPVHLPPGLVGETRPADTRLYLRLVPNVPNGLVVQIRMRPAPLGLYCHPGEGPEGLTGVAAGRRVAVVRDLRGEREIAEHILPILGLELENEERPWQWRIEDDDEALDLIFAAQEAISFGVVVEWPLGGNRRVEAKLSPSSLKIEVENKNDWFSLQGQLEVGGWRLTLISLLRALRQGRRYVQLGENDGEAWAEIAQGFRERLHALDDVVHMHRNKLEIDATAAPVLQDLAGDEATIAKASRRFRMLTKKIAKNAKVEHEAPPGLQATLRPYQLEGYRWMHRLADWGVGGCLADDMGLGKTVQTLAILLARAEEGPSLVVAPTSLGFNWEREAGRFAPDLKVLILRGANREKKVRGIGKYDVIVISYGLLVREIELLEKIQWGTLVLDEAQAIKNSHTKTSQAVRRVEAKWRLALTGTPIENHLGELWSLFRTISPGLLGSWRRFRDRFAAPIEKEGDDERCRALSRVVRPFVLRRTKKEVLTELPARTEAELYAELSPTEREMYEETRLKALLALADVREEQQQRFQVLAALTRLRQLACHPALADKNWKGGSAKLDMFLEIVQELREGDHRALVFSQFTQHLRILREALEEREISYQYLDGGTSVRERMRRVDAFQAGEGEIFLISLMAGGVGLNLTAADYVIHMDPWWNPAIEDQATDRAHRMGQQRPVTVYRLVARGTIEEEILALHADKRDLMAGVLEGSDRAGKLSTGELIGLMQAGDEDDGPGL